MEQIRWEVAKCLFEINQLFSPFKGSTSHSAHCLSAEHRDEISSAPSPHGHTFTVLFLATQHNLTIWTTNSTLSLFPALECYSCETDSNNDECVGNQTKATCQADANQCATGFIQSGDNKVKVNVKVAWAAKIAISTAKSAKSTMGQTTRVIFPVAKEICVMLETYNVRHMSM